MPVPDSLESSVTDQPLAVKYKFSLGIEGQGVVPATGDNDCLGQRRLSEQIVGVLASLEGPEPDAFFGGARIVGREGLLFKLSSRVGLIREVHRQDPSAVARLCPARRQVETAIIQKVRAGRRADGHQQKQYAPAKTLHDAILQ